MKCDHYWSYEHTVWQASDDDPNKVAIGRYCHKCGTIQAARISKWGPVPESFVDMTENLPGR